MPMPTLKGNESRTTNTYNLIHAEKKRENSAAVAKSVLSRVNLPVMGLEQAVQRLEKSSPKHSAQ